MAWVDALLAAGAAGRPVVLALVLDGAAVAVDGAGAGAPVGRHVVVGEDGAILASDLGNPALEAALAARAAGVLAGGAPRTERVDGRRVYLEPFLPPPELVVAGAGHVGQAVAQMGALLGFRVTVIDDRAGWASPERFPEAAAIIVDSFVPALRRLEAGPRHHVVLVTRSHTHDVDCLRELLARPVTYLGMIGSQTRIGHVFRLLEAEGADPWHFEKVHAPVGLDLGARTPAEIAVAVAAELVLVRRGGTGRPLSRLGRDRIHGRGKGQ